SEPSDPLARCTACRTGYRAPKLSRKPRRTAVWLRSPPKEPSLSRSGRRHRLTATSRVVHCLTRQQVRIRAKHLLFRTDVVTLLPSVAETVAETDARTSVRAQCPGW